MRNNNKDAVHPRQKMWTWICFRMVISIFWSWFPTICPHFIGLTILHQVNDLYANMGYIIPWPVIAQHAPMCAVHVHYFWYVLCFNRTRATSWWKYHTMVEVTTCATSWWKYHTMGEVGNTLTSVSRMVLCAIININNNVNQLRDIQ